MIFKETHLKGAYVIDLESVKDERGMFSRVFCENEFKEIGHTKQFVQINHSFNTKKGTFRGLHYQKQPFSEIKLIRCITGSVFDIIIDLRKNSNTFLKSSTIELSAFNFKMIYVPEGFAHGFLTLEENTQLIYHHTSFYQPGYETGLRFNDPVLGIELPFNPTIITEKDKLHPFINSSFKGI